MMRFIDRAAAALLMSCMSAYAFAQTGPVAPPPAPQMPVPGSGNSREITTDRRDSAADYNRAAGNFNQSGVRKLGSKPIAANADEIVVGGAVNDSRGTPIGTIEAVAPDGAVVASAKGRVKIPIDGFGITRKGLLLGMTKAEFDAAVAAATGG
jgi:hypothetical protein